MAVSVFFSITVVGFQNVHGVDALRSLRTTVLELPATALSLSFLCFVLCYGARTGAVLWGTRVPVMVDLLFSFSDEFFKCLKKVLAVSATLRCTVAVAPAVPLEEIVST